MGVRRYRRSQRSSRKRSCRLGTASRHDYHDSAPARLLASQDEGEAPADRSEEGKAALTRECPAQLLSADRISVSSERPIFPLITFRRLQSSNYLINFSRHIKVLPKTRAGNCELQSPASSETIKGRVSPARQENSCGWTSDQKVILLRLIAFGCRNHPKRHAATAGPGILRLLGIAVLGSDATFALAPLA